MRPLLISVGAFKLIKIMQAYDFSAYEIAWCTGYSLDGIWRAMQDASEATREPLRA